MGRDTEGTIRLTRKNTRIAAGKKS